VPDPLEPALTPARNDQQDRRLSDATARGRSSWHVDHVIALPPAARADRPVRSGPPGPIAGVVTGRSGADEPIQLHLPDGGHVIVDFADAAARADGSLLVDTLLAIDGSEQDVGRAIVEDLRGTGLSASVSITHRPTVVVVSKD
jgi:hypothetical protein